MKRFNGFIALPSRGKLLEFRMRLESQLNDGICILRLYGRFVTGSDAEVAAARNLLEDTGINRAVLDLQGVPYIDSTGLAFVVELHKSLVSRGGRLSVARPNQRVREVLEMTRIGEIIPIFDDVEDAEGALRAEVLC